MIVIERIHSGFIYSSLLKLLVRCRASRSFYDLDDADYLEYPAKTIYHFVTGCSGVFVGSRELVKNLSAFNRNIILNTSPTPDPCVFKKKKNAILTIGWIGDFGGDHKKALLKFFFPALIDLEFRVKLVLLGIGRKDCRDFDFVADYFRCNPNILVEMPRDIDWNNETEIQKRISKFDIGVATLLNNEFHVSKSAFKLKQYLNNGVPVLSSDLPENSFFLQDGVNGFLCTTPDTFRQRIIEINEMPEAEYMRLSYHARQSRTSFNLETYCETLLTQKGQSLKPPSTITNNHFSKKLNKVSLQTHPVS